MGLKKEGGESPHTIPGRRETAPEISFRDLAHTMAMLGRLAEWFDAFGNYTRANDCRRLADGLNLYADDIIETETNTIPTRKGEASHQRPWVRGYGE